MKGLVDTGENHHTEINAEGSNSEVGVIGVFVGGAKDSNQYASFTTSWKFRPAGYGSKKNFGFLLSYHRSKEKKRHARMRVSVLALPIFPGRRQPSIVSRNELNYRVRNGNGWTLALISTNCVVTKSALLCFRLRQKLHTLPCSSFSSRIRFAGFRSDQDLRLYVFRPCRRTSCIILSFPRFVKKSLVTRTGFEPMLTA